MNSRDVVLVKTLLETIDEIEQYLTDYNCTTFEVFDSEKILKRAVTMCMISVSELVDNLSDEFREEHPEINFRRFKTLRNIAAHKYGAINFEILWETINHNLPDYKKQFEEILREGR